MRWVLPILLLPALALLGAPMPATAQDGTVPASVSVLLPPATGAGLRPLEFGEVMPGVPHDIAPTDPTSGQFQISNLPRPKDVQFTLTVPTQLDRTGGGDAMPVSFGQPNAVQTCGNSCQYHTLSLTVSGSTASATFTHVRPPPPNTATINVFVGGQAQPKTTQAAGVYRGSIQLVFTVL